jgi:1-acyl-sn-glycerol-3-phosphate acyltransferase
MLRKILRWIVLRLFLLLSRLEIYGLENIPKEGGYILAANHMSRIDPPLIFCLIERDDITALVADKYKRYPLIRPMVDAFRGIWLNREQADFQAMREARDHLQNGHILGIAPEGTRSRTGSLNQAKDGVAYLAEKARAPVLPVGIAGADRAISDLLHFRRPELQIRFGKPFHLPPLDRQDRAAALQRNTDEIMCRIAALLPPRHWGAYRDHPRLKELLAETSLDRSSNLQIINTTIGKQSDDGGK